MPTCSAILRAGMSRRRWRRPATRCAPRRASKAMLITPGDEDCRSAGSFFKNPVLSEGEHQTLVAEAAARGLQIPSYPMVSTQKKVSAAWVVEHSGFAKGFRVGSVGISRKTRTGNRESGRRQSIGHHRTEASDRTARPGAVGLCS